MGQKSSNANGGATALKVDKGISTGGFLDGIASGNAKQTQWALASAGKYTNMEYETTTRDKMSYSYEKIGDNTWEKKTYDGDNLISTSKVSNKEAAEDISYQVERGYYSLSSNWGLHNKYTASKK